MKTESDTTTTGATDSGYRPLIVVGVVGLLMAAMATPVFGISGAAGIAAGALISVLNLHVLTRSVKAFLSAGEPGAWAVAAVFKLLVLVGLIYLLLSNRLVEGLPLLIGLGALPIGVVVCQLTATRQPVPPRSGR